MKILDYIQIGALVVALSIGGYYIWNYHHMQTVIADQKREIDNLKTEQDTIKKKQAKQDEYIEKQEKFRRRVVNEQKNLEKEAATVPDSDLGKLYGRYRLRPEDSLSNPAHGKTGGP